MQITMKTSLALLLTLLIMNVTQAQDRKSSLKAFENLIGGMWEGKGKWSSGTPFRQEKKYEWGLSGNLVKAKTFGNISEKGNEFGLRSEGVRLWSEKDSAIVFWEFDIFGGITEGEIVIEGKDLYYHYLYDFGGGPTELTDAWIYKSKDRYEFIVGKYRDGKWKQKFLTTEMKRTH